jgi:hypothetical protein
MKNSTPRPRTPSGQDWGDAPPPHTHTPPCPVNPSLNITNNMDTIHTLHYKYIILLYTNDNCRGPTPQQLKPITVGPFNDKYLETAGNNIVQTSTTFIVY